MEMSTEEILDELKELITVITGIELLFKKASLDLKDTYGTGLLVKYIDSYKFFLWDKIRLQHSINLESFKRLRDDITEMCKGMSENVSENGEK
jgi:hypothetical protein